jgi:hypothetical protein
MKPKCWIACRTCYTAVCLDLPSKCLGHLLPAYLCPGPTWMLSSAGPLAVRASGHSFHVRGGNSTVFADRSLACFQTLVQALQRESWVLSMHPITTAQIPVIKLTTPGPYPGAREIKMDLTFQSPLHRFGRDWLWFSSLALGWIGWIGPQRSRDHGRFCGHVLRVSTISTAGVSTQTAVGGT